MLYDSLHDKLAPLPDETLVYPTHGAGSLCGKNLSSETVSTIGVQRAYNYALAPMSRERFIETVTADLPGYLRRTLLDGHLDPVLEQLRGRVRLGRRTLLGSLASGVAYALVRSADTLPEPVRASRATNGSAVPRERSAQLFSTSWRSALTSIFSVGR